MHSIILLTKTPIVARGKLDFFFSCGNSKQYLPLLYVHRTVPTYLELMVVWSTKVDVFSPHAAIVSSHDFIHKYAS